MITYRHCRVVFGVSSGPFLLGAVIQHHIRNLLDQNDSIYPTQVLEKLLCSFYVDNCVTSVENDFELYPFIELSQKVMIDVKLDLRGWEYTSQLYEDGKNVSEVLGLLWNKLEVFVCLDGLTKDTFS